MRPSLPYLALLAAFGASLLGSGGVVSAAPLSPSFPRSEDSNVNPTLVESESLQPQTHTKRKEKERNEVHENLKADWYNTAAPYNWTDSPWSPAGIERVQQKKDDMDKSRIPTAYSELLQPTPTLPPKTHVAIDLATRPLPTPTGWKPDSGLRQDGDGYAWQSESFGSPYNLTRAQLQRNRTGQAVGPQTVGQRINEKRDGSERSIGGKLGDESTDSVRSLNGADVRNGEEKNEAPRLSERTPAPSPTQQLLPAGPHPSKTLGAKIPDDMYLDIITTALLARFTPEDKLAIRTQPKDKQLAKISAMVEHKVRYVMVGLYKAERRFILRSTRNKKDQKQLKKEFPELARDQGLKGGEQECTPSMAMAPCVLALWVMDVMGVPAGDVISIRSHVKSPDPLGEPIEILRFMLQRDPDTGFWRSWYDKEKKRMEGLPYHEARISETLMLVIKDAMVRGWENGRNINSDREWRLSTLPAKGDKLARFFSLLYHRGEHLKAGRPKKTPEGATIW